MYRAICECNKEFMDYNYWLQHNCNSIYTYNNNVIEYILIKLDENYLLYCSVNFKRIEKVYYENNKLKETVKVYYQLPFNNATEAKAYLIKLKDNLVFE